jgi:GH18 family chitinase
MLIYQTKNLHANEYSRVSRSKILVVIAFETNKMNTNVDHISNEKHIYYRLNSQKDSYVSYYVNWSGWKKKHFQLTKMHF